MAREKNGLRVLALIVAVIVALLAVYFLVSLYAME